MSQFSIERLNALDSGFILAPERYDPRKRIGLATDTSKHRLFDFIALRKEMITAERANPDDRYVVLDTGHARDGYISLTCTPEIPEIAIGSAKKVLKAGDVIISRLRPYLRQVAFVDEALCGPKVHLLCSSEFYVLRPIEQSRSIAFLVPLLLTPKVQSVLAAAQEGGHHPRFSDQVLLDLPIPSLLLEKRVEISHAVIDAIRSARKMSSFLTRTTDDIDRLL